MRKATRASCRRARRLVESKIQSRSGAARRLQEAAEFIVRDGYRTMSPIELFEANTRVHETIAELGGNRFIV
jgi:hypothetical protein